ncbi:MAG: hypothetical protein CL677_01955 [Bdellovibrionaceae bacterium]|nr:hypothetical protein [Pseudobdellovibrionaceae bacterium]
MRIVTLSYYYKFSDKLGMDKYLISGSLVLLLVQVFVLMTDLNLLPAEWGLNKKSQHNTEVIMGTIQSKHNNVRKKMNSSVYWEAGQEKDTLHAYDSILTLNNSSAQIILKNEVKLNLHENTLIVLEPSEEKKNANLVLMQFNKGRLRATTGAQKLKFSNKSWTIEAAHGSELSLRSVDDEKVEVELTKGEVVLANKDTQEVQSLEGNQRIELKKDEMKAITVDKNLSWSTNMEKVIYTHSPMTPVELQWKGPARSLLQINPDNHQVAESLSSAQTSTLKLLAPGNYIFRLEGDNTTSESFELSVLQAPTITYLAPLPRDRSLLPQSVVFSWTPLENIKNYYLELDSQREFRSPDVFNAKNYSQLLHNFKTEGQYFWRIKAVDQQGYTIPPLYHYELYVVDDALMAPQLINPTLRAPASKPKEEKSKKNETQKDNQGASHQINWIQKWVSWMIPSAEAEEMQISVKKKQKAEAEPKPIKKIVLSWSQVPTADHYIIEIADEPLFMNPLVNTKLKTNHFEWRGFGSKKYYWRVAAGKDDKKGLFSDVSEFDVTLLKPVKEEDALKESKAGKTASPVQLVTEAPIAPKPAPPPPATKPNLPPAPVEKPKKARVRRPAKTFASVGVHAQWISEENNEDDFKTTFEGLTPIAIGIERQWDWNETSDLKLNFFLDRREWEVEDSTIHPFQENLEEIYLELSLDYIRIGNPNSWGAFLTKEVVHERRAAQELESIDFITGGAQWNYHLKWGDTYRWQTRARLGLASAGFIARTDNWLWFEAIRHPHWGVNMGPSIDIMYIGGSDLSQTAFNLGFEVQFFW